MIDLDNLTIQQKNKIIQKADEEYIKVIKGDEK